MNDTMFCDASVKACLYWWNKYGVSMDYWPQASVGKLEEQGQL